MTSMKSEAARKWGLRLHVLWYVVANLAQIAVAFHVGALTR
jgi:hypothetical protein